MTEPSERAAARRYWRSNQRWIAGLLLIWFVVSFGFGILFAEPLDDRRIGRLPAGFWWAQQGAILVFVGLVFVYAWRMDRLDQRYRKEVEAASPSSASSDGESP